MPACESKLVFRSSRKTTVAKTVLIGYTAKMPVLNQPAVVLLARVDSQSAC